MFTLRYYESKERTPTHNSQITFYVLNDTCYLNKSLNQQLATVTYEWYSDCGEVSEYYNTKTESQYKVGETREAKHHLTAKKDSHKTVRLTMTLDVSGSRFPSTLWGNLPEEIPNLAWNYTHEVRNAVSNYAGDNYFPCFDINNLIRDGVITIMMYNKYSVGESPRDKHYRIACTAEYKGGIYNLVLIQDSAWDEDSWSHGKDCVYSDVTVFTWEKLKTNIGWI